MLRLTPPAAQYALMKADEAQDKARITINSTDCEFWREMGAKWLLLAESQAIAERLNNFLKNQGRSKGEPR